MGKQRIFHTLRQPPISLPDRSCQAPAPIKVPVSDGSAATRFYDLRFEESDTQVQFCGSEDSSTPPNHLPDLKLTVDNLVSQMGLRFPGGGILAFIVF